jgi:hypothetical protein
MPPTTDSQYELVTRILTLFDQLPPAAAVTVHEIFELLASQTANRVLGTADQPPFIYPTRTASADNLLNLSESLQVCYAGDALFDTESLYDAE